MDIIPTDEDDFFEIYELLQNQEARCYAIGTHLKLKPSQLETIKREAADFEDALRMIIMYWLQRKYNVKKFGPPTWQALVDAIQAPNGGKNTALAEEIAKKHPAPGNSAIVIAMQ